MVRCSAPFALNVEILRHSYVRVFGHFYSLQVWALFLLAKIWGWCFPKRSPMWTVSVGKAGAEYQNGFTHCDTILSHGAGICLYGTPVRTKRGNLSILAAMNSFSNFMAFFPVRSITSTVVC